MLVPCTLGRRRFGGGVAVFPRCWSKNQVSPDVYGVGRRHGVVGLASA